MSEAPIARRVLECMRRQVRSTVVNLAAFREGMASAQALQETVVTPASLQGSHPAHALYAHVQNQMSVMAEQLLELEEMKAFAKLIGEAHEEYMPSWPPMSPITTSYFWAWSNLDMTANAHRETLGSVILRVATEFGVHPHMLALMRIFNDSRMGVYWPEFVFEGYVNHRPGAIYLKGLPDVPASRPHSKEYVHHGVDR